MRRLRAVFGHRTDEGRAFRHDALKKLVADFNRDWPDVKRSRETLALAQEFVK
ncbi:hypothetical protein [Bradyrhizobium sacchari]|uniref:hypothetical protein n=1 Tax=Bradyrhizobium sacchari TaxID=1399419 RepID=UPI0013747F7B|nr:hypothetical protein [Bradyrhizobium sacchari]